MYLRPINKSPYMSALKLEETYHYATQNVPGRKGLGGALKLEQRNERETCDGKMLKAAPLQMMNNYLYKDRLAIAIRSLKEKCVTIVSLTQVLV